MLANLVFVKKKIDPLVPQTNLNFYHNSIKLESLIHIFKLI